MSTTIINKEIDIFFEVSKKSPNNIKLAKKVESGLPSNWITHLKNSLELTNAQIAELLGISGKTLERIRANQAANKLNGVISDRLYRVLYIFYKAADVFEQSNEAKLWLKTPQYSLANEVPLELLKTEAGTREVENLLGRIEHSVYT